MTAPQDLRAKLANSSLDLLPNLELMQSLLAVGLVLVSTCNRIELYVETTSISSLFDWLGRHLELDQQTLQRHIYVHTDVGVARHLMRVVSGLDSMVLGEVEIAGQLKRAYQLALEHGGVSKVLSRVFESAFAVAKKVRTQTSIGVNPISVVYLAVRLAERVFANLADQTVLLIGAGNTAQLALKHLYAAGVRRFLIANRTQARALTIGRDVPTDATVEVLALGEVPQVLVRTDMVVAATAAPLPIVGKGMVEQALKARKYRAMFMIDLSVPRNIEPQVHQLADVYLYGIDDLQNLATEHIKKRSDAVPPAQNIINTAVDDFAVWLDSQSSINTIQAFRHKCELQRDVVLAEALRQLKHGKEPQVVLEWLARTLLNRLIHEPTVQLRRASATKNVEILKVFSSLLALES